MKKQVLWLVAVLFALPSFADDPIQIKITKAQSAGITFDRVIIHNRPVPSERNPITNLVQFNESLAGLRVNMYARFLQIELQKALAKNFEDHAPPGDPTIPLIRLWLESYPHSQRRARNQGSSGKDGEAPEIPLDKVDDLMQRESFTILFTVHNDLSRIYAAVRVVATDPERIFWQLGGAHHAIERLGLEERFRGKAKLFQMEHLSFVRCPFDFFKAGLDAIAESKILTPGSELWMKTRKRLEAYYLGMGFDHLFTVGPAYFFGMKGDDFDANARSFLRGVEPKPIADPEIMRQVRLIFMRRAQQITMRMDDAKEIDYKPFLETFFAHPLCEQEAKSTIPFFIDAN